jgi:ribonuclease BN (tRNA processing enzyme)
MAHRTINLLFAGSGDAFGSGGRLQTCLCLSGGGSPVLLDCGASALVGLKRAGVDPNDIELIVLTHLHGDHFAGIPFVILDGQFQRRSRDLVVAGPEGTAERLGMAMDALYPGMSGTERRFQLQVVELRSGQTTRIGPAEVTGFEVVHASGAPALAVRLLYGGRTIAYSGDTEWTPSLIDAAQGSDVFICEAYYWDRHVRYHLDWKTLESNRASLSCSRLVLTHMSVDMLAHVDDLPADVLAAEDGTVLPI